MLLGKEIFSILENKSRGMALVLVMFYLSKLQQYQSLKSCISIGKGYISKGFEYAYQWPNSKMA